GSTWRSTAPQIDCSADWTSAGLHGTGSSCGSTGATARTGSWTADFPASTSVPGWNPAAGSTWIASTDASGRAPSDASDFTPDGWWSGPSAGSRARIAASGSPVGTSDRASGSAIAASGTALRSTWAKRRPNEGVRAAATAIALNGAIADYARDHDHRRYQS